MQDQPQIPQEIRGYLEGLLSDANMTLADSTREDMIKELYGRLDNFITGIVIDNLSSENLDIFLKMNEEKKSQPEIEAFLKEKMPNYQEVFRNAFSQFRELYLGNVDIARSAPSKN